MPEVTAPRSRRLPIVALLTANAVSLSGEAITAVAIPWYVYEATGSAAQMGIVGFFTVLPRVLAAFFGGTLVDRIGFKRTSVAADLLSGVAIAGIPLLAATSGLSFPLLIALVFLGALFDSPGATARESLVPELSRLAGMPLERINAIYQTIQRLALLVGPAVAGLLIALIGTNNVLWIDAATFGLSALVIGLLVPAAPRASLAAGAADAGAPALGGYWRGLVAGLRFIRDDALIFWLVIVVSVLNFVDAPFASVVMPIFARETYGTAESLGVLLSLLGAGAVVVSLGYAAVGPRLSRYRTFILCYFLAGLPFWVLALLPGFPVAAAALFAIGCASGPLNPIIMTLRQERIPVAIRARVFGAMTALAWVAIPLGQLVGGLVVEAAGVRVAFMLMGGSYLVVTVLMRFIPAFRLMDAASAAAPAGEAGERIATP